MKILLASPQANDTVMGVIGRYCERALLKLGHDTRVFDFRRSRYLETGLGPVLKKAVKKLFPNPSVQLPMVASLEREKMNRELCRALEESRPDVLFVLLGDGIAPSTLQKARSLGAVTVDWFPDPVLSPLRRAFVEEVSPYYDHFFMFDSPKVRERIDISSPHVMMMPLACSPETHRRMELTGDERREYGSDVVFIGTVKYRRGEVLAALKDLDLGIWGAWTERLPGMEKCYRRKNVFGDETVKIYNASKIVLDINESFMCGEIFNVAPRVFEAAGSGAFLLANDTPLLAEYFDVGREIVCYRDAADLKEKVRYYLAHPDERSEIAERGRRRALRDHVYEKRLERMLSMVSRPGA